MLKTGDSTQCKNTYYSSSPYLSASITSFSLGINNGARYGGRELMMRPLTKSATGSRTLPQPRYHHVTHTLPMLSLIISWIARSQINTQSYLRHPPLVDNHIPVLVQTFILHPKYAQTTVTAPTVKYQCRSNNGDHIVDQIRISADRNIQFRWRVVAASVILCLWAVYNPVSIPDGMTLVGSSLCVPSQYLA